MQPGFSGHVCQCANILGKAAAPVTQPCIQEGSSDTLVIAHTDRYLFHIGSQALTNLRDLVDKRDLCGQEGVGGIFNPLGRIELRDPDTRPPAQPERTYSTPPPPTSQTHHHPTRAL